MVEILCPHCEGEIELDDDASGDFECPLCEGEFEWNVEEKADFESEMESSNNNSIAKLIHPFEWIGHSLSIVTLVIIIICLSSNSWYNISSDGEDVMSFGLTEAEVSGAGATATTDLSTIVEEQQEYYDNYCVENSNSGCDEMKEGLDYWKSWRTSGLILNIILIICLVTCIIGTISRLVVFLSNIGTIELPDTPHVVIDSAKKFTPFIVSLLLLAGIIIYIIMIPGTELMSGGDGLDGSYGIIVWLTMAYSVILPVLTKLEIDLT